MKFFRTYAELLKPKHWVAFFGVLLFLSLSLDLGQKNIEYRLQLIPTSIQSDKVDIVFFGQDISFGNVIFPESGWKVIRNADSLVISAQGPTSSIELRAFNEPLSFGLLKSLRGGSVTLSNSSGYIQHFDLKSEIEQIIPLTIGGSNSLIPQSGEFPLISMIERVCIVLLLASILFAITFRMAAQRRRLCRAPRIIEVGLLSLPFVLSAAITLTGFIPGNIHYDGSLQWVQAAGRGELSTPIGLPTTYFMRVFAVLSDSPLVLVSMQCVFAACGAALVLYELRYRGISLWVAFATAVLLATSPQYPTFVTGLGKDALCLTGLLFFTYSQLAIFRKLYQSKSIAVVVGLLIASGLFVGLIRSNMLPVILIFMMITLTLIYRKVKDKKLIYLGIASVAALITLPSVFSFAAKVEISQHQAVAGVKAEAAPDQLPLGYFANLYIFHLFNAAIANGIAIPDHQAKLFFDVMPRDEWLKYTCHMTDDLMINISRNLTMDRNAYIQYLKKHQISMAKAVTNLALKHPRFVMQRQMCVTKMLWHAGIGQKSFQTTVTLGYDGVDARFKALAGESRSIVPTVRSLINKYIRWSEERARFWLVWKPVIPVSLALFIVFLYLVQGQDRGILLVALVPIASLLVLMLVIPFPAYRYVYPSVFICQMLCVLAFANSRREIERPLKISAT